MPEANDVPYRFARRASDARPGNGARNSTRTLRELWEVLVRRRRLVGSVVGGLLLACLLYCLIAPNQYEASARVALRTSPASALSLEAPEPFVSASILSAPVQQETLANVFRSDQLAWKVITGLKLYQAPGFMGRFASKFPDFRADAPAADAQAWLLERFQRRLRVQTLPRTLLIQIRFRCRDAALSASVVNAPDSRLWRAGDRVRGCRPRRRLATWLESQLKESKARVDQDQQRLAAFQREHGLLTTPETLANGQPGETQHTSAVLEIDELGRQLVAASTDRILREAQYRAASARRSGAGDRLRSAPAGRERQLCHRPACSRFTPAAANWNRNRPSSASNTAPTFPAWWRFAASCRIWTGRKRPRTPSWWSDSAAPGRRLPTASNWCARISKN